GRTDSTFVAEFGNTGTPCTFDVTGSYARKGLTVTETVTTETCAADCTFPAVPPKAGTTTCTAAASPVSLGNTEHTYLANLGVVDVLSQTDHTPVQFCNTGSVEEQVFTRID
ncbi:MAG TPA: hypothetical protein VL588_11455, partial [Bdellovibrionota bacterium]|nr:hypothetical protein [Bdellovibrionota bacterium]